MDRGTQYITPNSLWILEITLGVIGLYVIHLVSKLIVNKVRQKAQSHKPHWKQHLDVIFILPFQALLLTLGVYYVIRVLGQQFGFMELVTAMEPFRNAIIVVCLAWMVLRWKKMVLHSSEVHIRHASPSVIHSFNKILSIAICIIALMLILRIFHMDIVPLLAFGGIGAAAVGFAAKDVISNFCGGLMLSVTRPFVIGDLILLPEQNIEGYVEEVGWYLTCVRDKDKRPIYLPNAIFSNAVVINSARMSHRRINETIDLRCSDIDKLKLITKDIKSFLIEHPLIDRQIEPLVFFHMFKESSLGIYLDVYTLAIRFEEYLSVREEILLKIYNIIDRYEAKMAFPTITLDLSDSISLQSTK